MACARLPNCDQHPAICDRDALRAVSDVDPSRHLVRPRIDDCQCAAELVTAPDEAGPDGVEVLEFRSVTSFGMKIPGGQVERMRRSGQVAEEFGDDWAERRDVVARAAR